MINKVKFLRSLVFLLIFLIYIGNKNNINEDIITVLIFITVGLCIFNGYLYLKESSPKKT